MRQRLCFSLRCGFGVAWVLASGAALADQFTMTILHTNDMHAHVESTRIRGKLYGGYARLATLIQKYKASDPNPILLNGGDTFQGTLYFNVYEGLADAAFMNYAGFAAMAVGNHEFDRGPKALATFAKTLNFPLLASNLDVSADKDLNGFIVGGATSWVGKEQIAIVGAVTPELPSISSPGPTVRMLDLVKSCQANIDAFRSSGINKIILVTHVGYREEVELAGKLKGVDVIVGGHSHTLLGDIKVDGFSGSAGPYPTVTKNADGDTALVVQAHDWGKLLGRIKVTFDEAGKVVKWSDAAPILVDESVPEDKTFLSMIAALKKPIADLANKEVGQAPKGVKRTQNAAGESPMGNMIADAMLEATQAQGAVMACMNAGGVRGDLEAGTVTYGAAIAVQPFNNSLVLLDVTGAELLAALEHGVSAAGFLHISKGSSYTVDKSKPAGQRVSNVVVGGEKLDLAKTYRVCLNSFVAGGGDAHEDLKNAKGKRVDTGMLDIDALLEYLKKHSPVDPQVEGRVKAGGAVVWGALDLWSAATWRRYDIGAHVHARKAAPTGLLEGWRLRSRATPFASTGRPFGPSDPLLSIALVIEGSGDGGGVYDGFGLAGGLAWQGAY